ncbi:MAG: fumarylacetoacetate hydrolase family protein [Gammaproteobacteria bacterium]|nr:fumarylacetoacetate hydrolase family protein [Gammaproteobacteria bacterium]
MRWLSFRHNGVDSYGFIGDDGLVVDAGKGSKFTTLRSAIAHRDYEGLSTDRDTQTPRYELEAIEYLPPITNPDKILCVGLNYKAHQEETGRGGEANPTVFVRFAEVQVGHKGNMVRPSESNTLDYEGEIAMVIGRRGRRIMKEDFLDYVFGFSCYNDGSVREYQRHTSQFTAGKNFMNTGGFGPWIMTPDEIGDLNGMELKTHLNGKLMQHAVSSDLVFGFAELVAYCSTFVELVPGDIIVTGTPGGVGAARNPPVFMDEGDVVSISVDPIGTLENQVVTG